MNYRILHCGESLENYYVCLEQKISGFTKRLANEGDLVYFVVKFEGRPMCGARGIAAYETDLKPWEDGDRYVQSFIMKDMEYCKPFDLGILKGITPHWGPKYLQGSKPIKEEGSRIIIEQKFKENKIDSIFRFDVEDSEEIKTKKVDSNDKENDVSNEDEIKIARTYQTIKFYNETDKNKGLETLVSSNFYELFPRYSEKRTLLISDNRMFKTSTMKNQYGEDIKGISTIPDALMVTFNKEDEIPFEINLIEYECYGEQKTRTLDKFNYLNGHIIPQLMRFASAFGVVTNSEIRERTIEEWTDKIIDYINGNEELNKKVMNWVKELEPKIKERQVDRKLEKMLKEAFKNNIKVVLIIDELTDEQRDTISSILNSFKMENQKGISFKSYVVRLEQKIGSSEEEQEYGLSVQ